VTSSEFKYQGHELQLFALALRWKNYVRANLAPHVRDRVLEVGAGLGAVTRALLHDGIEQWTCLEPDPQLAARIVDTLSDHPLRDRVDTICGMTSDLESKPRYDTILYIDVLEHIQDDSEELRRSASLLREGGAIIVLAPAYAWLFSPFDNAVGHFRRYDATSVVAATPANLEPANVFYLDSIGLLLSLANRIFLRQSIPSRWQILFWDRVLIPLSRIIDPVIRFRAGRSIVAIWRKPRIESPANTFPAIGAEVR
jgi:2-polyprenyl-3-methyl-5-hydroxy-6-metoxy-1,4-benzoquinol methylase